jgi:predicted GNAT family acetyltransferase
MFVADRQAEIGAVTHAAYRGRNLAGIVTAHLIDHCLKAGIQPV